MLLYIESIGNLLRAIKNIEGKNLGQDTDDRYWYRIDVLTSKAATAVSSNEVGTRWPIER